MKPSGEIRRLKGITGVIGIIRFIGFIRFRGLDYCREYRVGPSYLEREFQKPILSHKRHHLIPLPGNGLPRKVNLLQQPEAKRVQAQTPQKVPAPRGLGFRV